MGAMIIGTGISHGGADQSSMALAAEAAKVALADAGVSAQDVDVLINVGIYRDSNMVEPAMAAIIQKQTEINLDYMTDNPRKAAFSFDLMNGGIGALNALQVADSMLQSNRARYVLIVASDIHPSREKRADFPFATVGSAMLLKRGIEPNRGLQSFDFHSKMHKDAGRTGSIKTSEMGITGRSRIDIVTSPDYEEALKDFATERTKAFVAAQKLSTDAVQLIPSQLSRAFVASMGKSVGLPSEQVTDLYKDIGDTHSSTFGYGLHLLKKTGKAQSGQAVLLAGASSGLATGCVLYVC